MHFLNFVVELSVRVIIEQVQKILNWQDNGKQKRDNKPLN